MSKQPGQKRLTSQDIAVMAGVSQATVSNVLNRPHLVSEKTRLEVLEVMASVGFVLNSSARALRAGGGNECGVLVLDISNPFWGELTRGVESVTNKRGQPLLLGSSNESVQQESEVLALFESHHVRGILAAPASADLSALRTIQERGTPVVLLDHRDPDGVLPSVALDHVAGARLVAEHLLANGHRSIAFVNGPHDVPWCLDRHRGFSEVVRRSGAHLDELVVSAMTAIEGVRIVDHVLGIVPTVTAVFCANDLLALGVLKGLARRGVRVPDDVSVVGYDDADFSELLSPALTTVRQAPFQIGREAALRLEAPSDLRERIVPASELEPPRIVVRESVRAVTPG